MTNSCSLTRYPALFLCLLLFSSCAGRNEDVLLRPPDSFQDEMATDLSVQLPDSSCSYFYLLWGTHAENNKQYQDAEEAFEKALICDPDSSYIIRRLPILLLRMGKPKGAAQWLRKSIEKFPEDTQDRILLARLAIKDKDLNEAIQLYKEVLEITPDDETILLRIGFLYSEQDRFLPAEQSFKRALSLNPQSLFAYLYLARLNIRSGETDQAEKYYLQALALNWSVDLAIEIAEFYGAQKKYAEVEKIYLDILTKHPYEKHAGLGLVHVLLLQDKEKEALNVLLDLREHNTDSVQIDMVTARLYLRGEHFENAAAILEPLATEEAIGEALYMLAVIRYQQEQMNESLLLLYKIESTSDYFEDGISLQVRIYMQKQQLSKAITILQHAVDNDASLSPDLYTLLASLYMEEERYENCQNILDAALQIYPDDTGILFEYGLFFENTDKTDLALQRMEEILLLEPDHAEALNYIGYTWADLGINLEQALQYILKAVELKPGNGYILDSLGWVYFRMGNLEEAAKQIDAALKLEPYDPHIHEHRGDIYQKLGQTQETRHAYKKAQELYKTEEKQALMQERIDAL